MAIGLPREAAYVNYHLYLAVLFIPLFAVPLVAWLFVPLYHNLRLTSAYEYLERRFDWRSRRAASLLFGLYLLLWMGTMLHATAHPEKIGRLALVSPAAATAQGRQEFETRFAERMRDPRILRSAYPPNCAVAPGMPFAHQARAWRRTERSASRPSGICITVGRPARGRSTRCSARFHNRRTSSSVFVDSKLRGPLNSQKSVQVNEPSGFGSAIIMKLLRGQIWSASFSICHEPSGAGGMVSSL